MITHSWQRSWVQKIVLVQEAGIKSLILHEWLKQVHAIEYNIYWVVVSTIFYFSLLFGEDSHFD